jgi:CRP-like cAMP-binding protein
MASTTSDSRTRATQLPLAVSKAIHAGGSPMSKSVSRDNSILERVSARERKAIFAVIQEVVMRPGQLICRAGTRVKHVYFPRRGVISLFAVGKDGPDVGVGMVREDGMFGLCVAVGHSKSHLLAVAQGAGEAYRIESSAFLGVLGGCPSLQGALFTYSQSISDQMARNVLCVARHPAKTRLARWMLDVTAGSNGSSFCSTQETTATSLGLQRPAISYAASALQRLGLIRYLRGEVTILNRKGLRAVACNCSG